ncbi:MAG: helix-turn-helix domain-containing protein [Verrucomicrobia bacterium]|nr:helix-turn-helix domain-containing protein [Verrucomicrobiota bacterium]MCF7707675.1 helix-turn-helix domain-containing protein [Verrucomicrobiota bacterium]
MPTVAEQLKHAREERGLSIYQVAEVTKIKTNHVRALDAGDYDVFSATVYIRGFIRTYAKTLKLDVEQIMRQLDEELGQIEKFREPPRLGEKRSGTLDFLMLQFSKINWRIILPVLGIIVLLLLIYWGASAFAKSRSGDPLSDLGPGMYQEQPKQQDNVLPLPEE